MIQFKQSIIPHNVWKHIGSTEYIYAHGKNSWHQNESSVGFPEPQEPLPETWSPPLALAFPSSYPPSLSLRLRVPLRLNWL